MPKHKASFLTHNKLTIDGTVVPVKIFNEHRTNCRFSVGSKALIARIPLRYSPESREQALDQFRNWAAEVFAKHPQVRDRFSFWEYQNGDTLIVGQRQYQIRIEQQDRKTNAARLRDQTIFIRLNQEGTTAQQQAVIRQLLSRVVAQDYSPWITERVHWWNNQYFKKEVKQISLKHNRTNWGSCSAKKNINLSTRLLFAPQEVIDYVIVHELAHLIELNHSARFWKLVEDVLPNYQEQEAWLKANGSRCNF